MVISPNPIAFELKHLAEKDQDTRMAARLAGLERLLTINKLGQAGIQILDWHIDTPLDQAISAALSRPVQVLALAG